LEKKEKHTATIGVYGIPQDMEGRGLWSKRFDGKGINAIGGTVDPEDAQNARALFEVLKREFREEAGVEIELVEERPLGVFTMVNLQDIAVLFNVRIISGEPTPSPEATEHIWMDPSQIAEAAKRYDEGDKANGLLSGKGKRQWRMAKAFFVYASQNTEFRKRALSEM
jgi:8-oxo-dGTP pyrophosphatase MutT (NUDIX family)